MLLKNKIFYLGVTLTCFFFLIIFTSQAYAANYYIATNGSDSSSGTLSQPWRTIDKANNNLTAGDTVYIRGGTYNQRINPQNSGTASQRITYTNYNNEEVYVTGQLYNIGAWVDVDYITIDGFKFDIDWPNNAGVRYMDLRGNHIEILNCEIIPDQDPWATFDTGLRETGIVVSGEDILVQDCTIKNISLQCVGLGTGSKRARVIDNEITNCMYNSIAVSYSHNEIAGHLIQGNILGGNIHEDGIQFNPSFDGASPTLETDNQGVYIKDNIIKGSGENGIDLKGAKYIVIDGNILFGSTGDNNGPVDGNDRIASRTIMHGSGTNSEDVIIRNNVIYDNAGGIFHENGYRVYNNTVLGNNRDYTGPNSSYWFSYRPYFSGLFPQWSDDVVVLNNIVGGHKQGDSGWMDSKNFHVDYNLYTNDQGTPKLVDYSDGASNWEPLITLSEMQTILANSSSVSGNEAHSFIADPEFVNATSRPVGDYQTQGFDFSLQSNSPAIDAGTFLTETTSSGSGTTLTVDDAKFFSDGLNATQGDLIVVGNNDPVRITDVNYSTNQLTLNQSISWNDNDNVSLPYSGSAPDIGAYEYQGDVPDPVCGDGTCNGAEDCSTCQTDCSCSSGQTCCSGECQTPTCSQDTDCGTNTSCTTHTCNDPGTCSASCSSTTITQCIDDDGCCPSGCTQDTDNDCASDADTTPPTTPTDFAANSISTTQIDLSWTASTDDTGVSGYKIYRNDTQIDTTTNVTYQDTDLSPNTTYTYTVSAYDSSSNESNKSQEASATTLQSSTTDLVAHYKFNETTGTTASDSSGNNNIGTLYNGPTWTAGQLDGGLNFDGTDDYLEVSESSDLSFGNTSFTLSAWVKKGGSGDSGDQYPIAKGYPNTSQEQRGYGFRLDKDSQRFLFFIQDDSMVKVTGSWSSGMPAGEWHHLVGVVNRSQNTMKAYYDGEQLGDTTDISSIGDITSATSLRLGQSASGRHFNGTLDDVRVYDYALTQTEIENLYNQPSQTNYVPVGNFDGADTTHITGWAYDENAGTDPIDIHIYIDGTHTETQTANLTRSGLGGQSYNGTTIQGDNHGFDYTLPTLSEGDHTISVYAINTPTGNNPELDGSPRTITIEPDDPSPQGDTYQTQASEDNLLSSKEDQNFGSQTTWYVGARQDNEKDRVLLKFPDIISSTAIPQGSTVSQAELTLTNAGSQYLNTSSAEVKVRKVLESWTEGEGGSSRPSPQTAQGESNWNYKSYDTTRWLSDTSNNGGSDAGCSSSESHTTINEASKTFTSEPQDGDVSIFDVTNIVQDWATNGESSNYGFIVIAPNYEGNTKGYIRFASSEHTTTSYRPKLTITYTPPTSPSDTTPPTRSNGQPTGALSQETTQATLSLETNENATCKYSQTANTGYSSIPNTFSTTGSTSHSTTLTNLADNTTYTYYIRCQDEANNSNTDDYQISFTIPQEQDTTPPTIPTNLDITHNNPIKLKLTWSNSTDNIQVSGYKIYRNGTQIDTTINTIYYQNNLNPKTTYLYAVSAYDSSDNESNKTQEISVTTFNKSDLSMDNSVNSIDFGIMLSYWGDTTKPPADFNQNGIVDSVDFGIMMSEWGS